MTGSVTVHELVVGPEQLERVDVSFEQRCEGGEPALRGRVAMTTPVPPPLEVSVALSPSGAVDPATGEATVSGTVTCNRHATANLQLTLSQRATRARTASGSG